MITPTVMTFPGLDSAVGDRVSLAQHTACNANNSFSCLQEEAANLPYPTVRAFMEYVRNRVNVLFKRLDDPKVYQKYTKPCVLSKVFCDACSQNCFLSLQAMVNTA